MKGVILAGGTGTRLWPLTKLVNKHLLPVGKHPMIHYSIRKMKEAGIHDILLVIGKQSAGMYMNFLGGGEDWGVNLTYKIQEKAGGIAEALSLANGFIQPKDKFVVILGDNLFEDPLTDYVQAYEAQERGAMLLLKEVEDSRRYGVPHIKGSRIVSIEEKPKHPQSNFCVTGIYMYDFGVFQIIQTIKPSVRGELEITDVNNCYAEEGTLTYNILEGWWTDAGTIQSLHDAGSKLMEGE
ncbi:MAG: Nucleotidyl transferase [Paenibacillus sp.]|jgi:glucose-1-phosphate thymidylyltransferase|nr:Nucleotidyl transferase [Paenibacillus sp.]